MNLPDPRTQGSKNPGATNVLRIGGKKAAVFTLLGDVLKGFMPVFLGDVLGLTDLSIAFIAFAAFLGHLFPLFFQFKGGKGVATLLGCLFALNYIVACAWLLTWLMVAGLFRYSSLAALIASALTPFYFWYLSANPAYFISTGLMALILIYRHQSNIKNLLKGKEKKIF
jgi:glycerol-3-phosphate acyltransferase PlsY